MKVLTIRVELSDAQYAAIRQFYTDREIRETICFEGVEQLLSMVECYTKASSNV